MEEMARVVKVLNNGMAEVELKRHSACSSCGGCKQIKESRFEVVNPIDAREGDMVLLAMSTRNLITAVLIVYLLPLINLLIGFGLGSWINSYFKIGTGEGVAIVCGLILMGVTFFFVRFYDRQMGLKSGFKPQITRILYE